MADYSDGLRAWRAPAGRTLVVFLGSSIGNYEPAAAGALLRRVREGLMRPGDALLLGTDRPKDPPTLLRAYDDSRGVTARFNRNLLCRINRELGGRFEVDSFAHRVVWDARRSRIEMHLESRRRQRVPIAALDLEVGFAAGERVHTENSYKLTARQLERIRRAAGLAHERTWTDPEGRFALHLLRAPASHPT